MFIPSSDISAYHQSHKNEQINIRGQDERELDQALERSLKEMGREDGGEGEEAKEPEEPKFQAFTGKGTSLAAAEL